MHFGVLGPLIVVDRESDVVQLTAPMLRRLLAALLTRANEWVSVDDLVQALWGTHVPPSARKSLQVYVRRLRQTLGDDRRIVHGNAGYRIIALNGELDAAAFAQEIEAARYVGPERAYGRLRSALAMWRGRAYDDVREHAPIADEARRLDQERLRVEARCAQLQLELGQHEVLIPHLTKLTELHQYNEDLRCYLMLALYRCGRQIEALELFHATRKLFADELGVEPGPALQRLHQAILRNDVSLDVEASKPTVIPRELPPAVSGFAGRSAHMSTLDILLGEASSTAVVAITGSAGIGKTTLAIHWAHATADRFPDGQLYVNLRGFDPAGHPVDPAAVIRRFLHALGVAGHQMPTDPDAQASLYRSLLNGKRILILLDNARDSEQARPLLPGSTTCRTVVTSRNSLTSLVATSGASSLGLDALSPAEATQLLIARLGESRVAAEPESANGLVAHCAGVPLALAVVAARATTLSGTTLHTLEHELRGARGSLGAFDSDDPATDLRAVFSWSYDQLGSDAARLFRMLGLYPGPDISAPAAASMVAQPVSEVAPALNELSRAHLVAEPTPGRFTFHDLLRAYAVEQGRIHDTATRRRAAQSRLLDYYLHSAHRAGRLLEPHRTPIAIPDAPSNLSIAELDNQDDAQAWLEREYQVLAAAVGQAADAELGTHAWQLAWSLSTYLDWQGHSYELAETHRVALTAAQKAGDLAGEGYAHHGLARAYVKLGCHDDAYTHLKHAVDKYGEAGNRVSQANAYLAMAHVLQPASRFTEALDHAELAFSLFQGAAHRVGQVAALNAIGWFHSLLGDHQKALHYCEQALAQSKVLGDINTQADIWDSIGHAHQRLASYSEAIRCYQTSISLYRGIRNLPYQAMTMSRLGDTFDAAGHRDAAHLTWTEALEIVQQLGDADEERRLRGKLGGEKHSA